MKQTKLSDERLHVHLHEQRQKERNRFHIYLIPDDEQPLDDWLDKLGFFKDGHWWLA